MVTLDLSNMHAECKSLWLDDTHSCIQSDLWLMSG